MSFDRPRRLVLSYTWDLPFGPGKRFLQSSHPVVRHLVGGWQFSGVHSYDSGVPVVVSTRGTIPILGAQWAKVNPDVPIRTGSSCSEFDNAYPSGQYAYLNRSAFFTPAPFTFGDTRTLPNIRQCSIANENISIIKSFPIRENLQVRFGAVFFNIFNRHYWTGLQTDIDNPALFGRFTGTTGPRTGQLWLKVEF